MKISFFVSVCVLLRSLVEVVVKSCRFQRRATGVGNKWLVYVSLNVLENTMKTICVFISSPGYLRKIFKNGFEHHGCGRNSPAPRLNFRRFGNQTNVKRK